MTLQSTTGTLEIVIRSQTKVVQRILSPSFHRTSDNSPESRKNACPHRLILGINIGRAPSARPRMHRATPATWRRSKFSSPRNDYRDWSMRQGGGPSSPLGIHCCRGWQKPRNSPTRWRRRGRRSGRKGPCLRLRGLRHGVWGFEKCWLAKWSVRTRHVCHVGEVFRNSTVR